MLLASNRGPVSFRFAGEGDEESPRLTGHRGGGGLVSALAVLHSTEPTVWVCAALSDADRHAARTAPSGRIDLAGYDTGDPGGTGVRMLDIDRLVYDRAYNAVANRTLWFVAHLLFDTATSPSFGPAFRREWDAYDSYCAAFADALAEEAAPGATVIVQDYHLALTPLQLRQRPQDILRHAGMGGMAALLVSSVVGFGASGSLAAIASAGAATAIAAVVAWRGRSMAVVVLAGGAVYAVIELACVILG